MMINLWNTLKNEFQEAWFSEIDSYVLERKLNEKLFTEKQYYEHFEYGYY